MHQRRQIGVAAALGDGIGSAWNFPDCLGACLGALDLYRVHRQKGLFAASGRAKHLHLAILADDRRRGPEGRHRRGYADRADQPDRHQRPHGTYDPARRFFQQRTEHDHGQDHHTARRAHVQQLDQQCVHFTCPPGKHRSASGSRPPRPKTTACGR